MSVFKKAQISVILHQIVVKFGRNVLQVNTRSI